MLNNQELKIGPFQIIKSTIILFLLICSIHATYSQAPSNDNCSNASVIPISNAGYGFGIFNSTTDDISKATVQTGETFAPAILVGGQNQKSMWYKFSLPTTRSLRVTLLQPGIAIAAGDAGFAVYKSDTCLPGNSNLSPKSVS